MSNSRNDARETTNNDLIYVYSNERRGAIPAALHFLSVIEHILYAIP